jgi:NADH-quinone oxidoreductase subunit C
MTEINQSPTIEEIKLELKKQFLADDYEPCNEACMVVPPENIIHVCKVMKDKFHFELLAEETAVDYWPEETPRFHLIYRLRSIKHNLIFGLRVALDGNAPIMPSLVEVYNNANWFEREIWDMFGIRFEGHPDLRRVIMPYDWEGHPLRKDYPLGYEEVQYTFNFNEIDVRKPYAEE